MSDITFVLLAIAFVIGAYCLGVWDARCSQNKLINEKHKEIGSLYDENKRLEQEIERLEQEIERLKSGART